MDREEEVVMVLSMFLFFAWGWSLLPCLDLVVHVYIPSNGFQTWGESELFFWVCVCVCWVCLLSKS